MNAAPRPCEGGCGRRLTDPASLRRGYGPVCWAKTRHTPAAAHLPDLTPMPATTGQLALEDTPMTDFRFTVDLPSGPADASITLPGSEHTVPDERGCPDCDGPAYFSGCDADGCNGWGCQDCGTGCDLDFVAVDGRCAQDPANQS